MKIVLKLVSWLLIGAVVVLAFLLVGVRLFGLEVYTVLSGSMEPELPTGSLIYVREVDPASLKANDVITFKLPGGVTATHRIVEPVPDEDDPSVVRFRTKGDANEVADGALVEQGSVIGTPVFCIPLLGYFAAYIKRPPWIYIAIAVAVALVIPVFAADAARGEKKDRKHSSLAWKK